MDHSGVRTRHVRLLAALLLVDGSLTCLLAHRASRAATKAFDDLVNTNSSQGGGSLPSNYRYGRINYNTETILPTRWWMWK